MAYCTHCGAQIAEEAVICLNCGCVPGRQPAIPQETEPQLAVWAKICGLVSFFVGWVALGITAIVLANMSKSETGGVMCDSAKAGYICGILSTVLSVALLVIIICIAL